MRLLLIELYKYPYLLTYLLTYLLLTAEPAQVRLLTRWCENDVDLPVSRDPDVNGRHQSIHLIILVQYLLLSVQCNALHGTEYKITCGVSLCVLVCVWVCVCARDLGAQYLENG